MSQIVDNAITKIDKARTALTDLSIKENAKTNSALIKALKKEILVARKKGKTWSEISEALAQANIKTTPALLSIVFNSEKSKKNGEKTNKNTTKKTERTSKTQTKNNENAVAVPSPGAWGAVLEIEPGHHIVKADRTKL